MEESLQYLQFMENAEEEEAWLGEKDALVSRGDSGDTLAATQVRARQYRLGHLCHCDHFDTIFRMWLYAFIKLDPVSWIREIWMRLLILSMRIIDS